MNEKDRNKHIPSFGQIYEATLTSDADRLVWLKCGYLALVQMSREKKGAHAYLCHTSICMS